jgi:hypothetical protein
MNRPWATIIAQGLWFMDVLDMGDAGRLARQIGGGHSGEPGVGSVSRRLRWVG